MRSLSGYAIISEDQIKDVIVRTPHNAVEIELFLKNKTDCLPSWKKLLKSNLPSNRSV